VSLDGGGRPAAVVVAHPGHELRVHRWLEIRRPVVHCLTDGSGRAGESRTASTSALLHGVGATEGAIFGRLTDRAVYRMLLAGECDVFERLLVELTESLIAGDVATIVGDTAEGMNPIHDLCRCLIDCAVEAIARTTGRRLENYEFPVDASPVDCAVESRNRAVWIELDAVALDRKLRAARGYAELQGELDEALSVYGPRAFAVECLRPPTTPGAWERFEHEPPAYERFGREGAERFGKKYGGYAEVITFAAHVKPALRAIERAGRAFPDRA
jgi:hypothetical protein